MTQDSITPAPPLTSAVHDLEGEAMRRRISGRLFGGAVEAVRIGRFHVLETLGQGAMGIVYAAEDVQLGRQVALKVIRDDTLGRDPIERERLLKEARALARLSHPNVVQVHEVGEHEGAVFIVMELVHGTTLRRWLDLAERPLTAVLAHFVEAAQGLDAAHRVGIVHRDFKPANALVGADGRVRIVDFGLARGDPREVEATPHHSRELDAGHAPSTERRAGTPAYMSPEQALGARCDARSDQFSFCVALFEAVYGRRPLDPEELVRRARQGDPGPAPPPGGQAPRWLRRLLARGLAIRPEDRFPSMAALIAALQRAPLRRRQLALAAAIVVALITAGAIGVAVSSTPDPCPDPRERLAGIWDPARRGALRRAFATSSLARSEQLAERSERALDEYTGRWLEVRRTSCEATWVRGEQSPAALDRETRCLEDARRELANLSAALAAGDSLLVAEAETLIAALPDLARCRGLPADDGPIAPRDAELATLLDRARMYERTLQGRQADAALVLALARSARLGEVGGEAEAQLLLGRTRARLHRQPHEAIDALHRAIDGATRAGRKELLAPAWTELAWVTSYELDDAASGRRWLAHARSAVPELPDPVAEAELLAVESQLLETEGHAPEAVDLRRRVIELLSALHPADHPVVLVARHALAVSLGNAGALEAALAEHDALWRELSVRFGADHPWTARVELDLGLDAFVLDRLSQARTHVEHARQVLVSTYGASNPRVATADLTLAQIDGQEGALDRAISHARRALTVYSESFPREHDDRISALALLAQLYLATGRIAANLEVNRELLAIHDEGLTTRELDLPGLLTNIGECTCDLGRCGDALPYFSRLMAMYEQSPPEEAVMQAFPYFGVGRVHLSRGEPALALPFIEQALAIFEKYPLERAGMAQIYASGLRSLAAVLQTLHREPRRARALRLRAEAYESGAPPP